MWRIALLAGVAAIGFASGWRVDEWRHAASDLKAAVHTINKVQAQGQINTAAAAHDVQVQTQIRYVTRTQVKEVPIYVSAQTDRSYPLPIGLVRLHDAAALGLDVSAVPDSAGRADDAAAATKASEFGQAIAGNYGECRADQARLTALQDWITAQVATH